MARGKQIPTKLAYFDDMQALQSTAIFISLEQVDVRLAMVLDSTIFHPQGGGQPADKGVIFCSGFRFVVEDVRSNDGVVFHFGYVDNPQDDCESNPKERQEVTLQVDAQRRDLNSRLECFLVYFVLKSALEVTMRLQRGGKNGEQRCLGDNSLVQYHSDNKDLPFLQTNPSPFAAASGNGASTEAAPSAS